MCVRILGVLALVAAVGCDRDAPPRSSAATQANGSSAPRSDHAPALAPWAPLGPARACGVERWDVKIGADPGAPTLDFAAPRPATVPELRLLRQPTWLDVHTPRQPEERIVRQLSDVRLVCVKYERDGDRDLHLVVEQRDDAVVEPSADRGCALLREPGPRLHTMIVEVPDPECVPESQPWRERIARVRALVQAETHPGERARRVNRIVSLRGVTFFDVVHGQLGVAPNGIELHPVLAMCFGAGCALD